MLLKYHLCSKGIHRSAWYGELLIMLLNEIAYLSFKFHSLLPDSHLNKKDSNPMRLATKSGRLLTAVPITLGS